MKKHYLEPRLKEDEKLFIKQMAGIMPYHLIAKTLNISYQKVRRYVGYKKINNKDKLINEVLEYFKNHTREETEKYFKQKYPFRKIYSILKNTEKREYKKSYRYKSDAEKLLEKIKQIGVTNTEKTTSVKKFLKKDYYINVNGLNLKDAQLFVNNPETIAIKKNNCRDINKRYIVPWISIEKNLKKDLNPDIVRLIKMLIKIQKWLYQKNDPLKEIQEIIKNDKK